MTYVVIYMIRSTACLVIYIYLYDPIDCVRHAAATEWGKYTEKTVLFCQLIAEFNTMQERKQNILTSVLPFGSETAGSNNQ